MRQKLHLLTLKPKEFGREAFRYVFINKKNVIVTNAFALVIHMSDEILPQYFVDSLPDGDWLIKPEAAKAMNDPKSVYSIENGVLVVVSGKNQKMLFDLIPLKDVEDGEMLLKSDEVVPKEFNKEVNTIGVNPLLLYNTIQAIDPDCDGAKLSFCDDYRAIKVEVIGSSVCLYKAIIMPMMINQ